MARPPTPPFFVNMVGSNGVGFYLSASEFKAWLNGEGPKGVGLRQHPFAPMKLIAIMALSDNGIYGVEGREGPTIPWRLPPDLKRFKEITTGHSIIMGRKTFDSIGKALPNRNNIVLSRSWSKPQQTVPPNVYPAESVEKAIEMAHRLSGDHPAYVIGGGEIWNDFWEYITRIELTRVHTTVGLGSQFAFNPTLWREVSRSATHDFHGESGDLKYTFFSYELLG